MANFLLKYGDTVKKLKCYPENLYSNNSMEIIETVDNVNEDKQSDVII